MFPPSFLFSNKRGFTLIEMLVSMSIIGVVLSVILSNQSTYTEAASLSGAADELATRLREAQIYGIGVKERVPGTEDFSSAYGISVNILGGGSPTSYIIFVDRNGNEKYDGGWTCPQGVGSECIEKVDLTNGNYFYQLCNIKVLPTPPSCQYVRRVDITFVRPKTEANIIYYETTGGEYLPLDPVGERFTLKSPSGLTRYVSVYLNGQIWVHSQ